jgi:5-hydroxyisourate hydrolase-like protein (transthyretin family)
MNMYRAALFLILIQALPQPAASIQGRVLNAGTGEPVSGARVELIRVDGTSPQSYTSISEPNGNFIIQNARPGAYRLTASRNGYLKREFGQRSRSGMGLTLNLEGNPPIRNLEIELRPAAVISGRVTDREGDPVGVAEVKALVPAYQDGHRILRTVQSTLTNDLGEYRLFGLSAGQYYVSATPSGDTSFMTLIASAVSTPQAGIPGISTAATSKAYTSVYYPSTTDSRIATPLNITGGAGFGGVNISMIPLTPHHIRGNVPGGMAHVTLVPGDPGLTIPVRDADASNGPFDFPNVASGEYTLVARSGELMGTASVYLGDGDLDNVSVGLSPSVSVPTRVSFDDRKPGEMDPDLESVNMNLVADPSIPGVEPDTYGPFSNGSLAFGVMLRQNYRITSLQVRNPTTSARLRDIYIKSIQMGSHDVLNDGFRIDDPGNIVPIEIVLGTRSGTLSGTVVSEKQKPDANATVLLVPDSGSRRWADAYRTANTDIAGRFTLGRIAPGDYIVFSWEEVEEGSWMDPEFIKKYEQRGKRIHINEGGNQMLSITAIP